MFWLLVVCIAYAGRILSFLKKKKNPGRYIFEPGHVVRPGMGSWRSPHLQGLLARARAEGAPSVERVARCQARVRGRSHENVVATLETQKFHGDVLR